MWDGRVGRGSESSDDGRHQNRFFRCVIMGDRRLSCSCPPSDAAPRLSGCGSEGPTSPSPPSVLLPPVPYPGPATIEDSGCGSKSVESALDRSPAMSAPVLSDLRLSRPNRRSSFFNGRDRIFRKDMSTVPSWCRRA